MKKKTKKKPSVASETIRALDEALAWTKGYKAGLERGAEVADAVLMCHGASLLIRQRMAKRLKAAYK